ncbi:MAG: 4-hydroxythreonine-4-phosphate dehydrogenase PdxA [Proteobacteria bacterium]|nr:MAG: 4-hydroxythreonine-4-phosphate dehydrogenase PdxA [Pseudomonadota bacterium]
MRARLVVSVGCPSGIGPEVSVVAARELAADCDIVLVGDLDSLRRALEIRKLDDVGLTLVSTVPDGFAHAEAHRADPRPVLRVWQPTRRLGASFRVPGKPSREGGVAQLAWIEAALSAVREGHAQALVTGPVSKGAIASGGLSTFRGHTEYLAGRCDVKHVTMAFATEAFTTALVTTHLPLAKVPRAIDDGSVARALIDLGAYLVHRVPAGTRPRIAVCGLNPHAGEGGLIGTEETRIAAGMVTARAVFERLAMAVDVVGPVPAEAAFRQAKDGAYHGVLAMYHDQATIPTKLLGFGEAVNITLGLPVIRTSVDHGTAYDQAGKGTADARGMVSALQLAAVLCEPRAEPWPFTDRRRLSVSARPRTRRPPRTPAK